MQQGAEKIMPYDDGRDKGPQVREMFDNIAPAYDFMNRAMTFGIDRLWRAKAVGIIRNACPGEILDVATGTADLAIEMARKMPQSRVTGIDLSEGMVSLGREKVEKAGLQERVSLTTGDCLALPFADCSFDCVTVAYGVRNFERLADGYREMLRVLRPGGLLCVIELSTPQSPWVRPFYNFYTRHIIPAIGRLVSDDRRAYTYLPESIAAVAQGREMTDMIAEAGFAEAQYRRLTFGACTIYTARRPQ